MVMDTRGPFFAQNDQRGFVCTAQHAAVTMCPLDIVATCRWALWGFDLWPDSCCEVKLRDHLIAWATGLRSYKEEQIWETEGNPHVHIADTSSPTPSLLPPWAWSMHQHRRAHVWTFHGHTGTISQLCIFENCLIVLLTLHTHLITGQFQVRFQEHL